MTGADDPGYYHPRRWSISGSRHYCWCDRTELLARLKRQRCGSWEVIGDEVVDRRDGRKLRSYVLCRCAVTGVTKLVSVDNLIGRKTRGPQGLYATKHGGSEGNRFFYDEGARRLADRYDAIHQRCNNPDYEWYPTYGGRGIRCLFRDRDHFVTWCKQHLPHPDYKGLQIDRIDNHGHYEPGNLRLVPHRVNLRNTRRNRYIEYRGVKVVASDLWHLLKRDYPWFDLSPGRVATLVARDVAVQEILGRSPRPKRRQDHPAEADPEILVLYPSLPPLQFRIRPRRRPAQLELSLPEPEA